MSSLTWRISAGVGGVPGPAPDPDRDAVAGDGHPDDDLGQVVAVVLGLAVGPEPAACRPAAVLVLAGPPVGHGTAVVVVAGTGSSSSSSLEVGAGGVEEQQVDFEVEQVRDLAVRPPSPRRPRPGAASPSPGSRRRRWCRAAGRYGPCGPTQCAAASLEEGSSARLATSANSTRSVAGVAAGPAQQRGHDRGRCPAAATAGPAGRSRRRRPTPVGQPGRAAAAARPGSSSRASDPASRSIAARSSWSSRPKLCSTRIRDAFGGRVPLVVDQLQVADGAAVLVPPRRSAHEHVTRYTGKTTAQLLTRKSCH